MAAVSDICKIDPSRIAFGRKDGKYVRTTIGGEMIKFTIGSLKKPVRAPFGISEPYNPNEVSDRLTMDLEIADPDLLDTCRAIDEAVISAAMQHSQAWFGKQLNEASIRAMHMPIVKDPTKIEYEPTLRTKVNVGASRPTAIFVHMGPKSVKRGSKEAVGKGTLVAVSVGMSSVMFYNKHFGVSLYCDEVMVKPREASRVSAFGDFDVEEEETEDREPRKKKAKYGAAAVEDGEDEDDSD